MTSHVDAETLALSAEGLLDDEEERSVRTHVAGCSQCADIQAALGDVPGLLAEAPVPPLPESVSARLGEAIRAEREGSASVGGTPSAAEEDGDSEESARSEGVAGSGAEGSGSGSDRDAERPVDGDAAEELRSRAAEVVPMRRRGAARWMPYIAAAAAAVFVFGGGAALLQGMSDEQTGSQPSLQNDGEGRPHAINPYNPVLVESGTEYTPEGLEGEAGEVLSVVGPELPPDGPESDEEAPEVSALPSPSAPPSHISTCVEELTGDGEQQPALVDVATYTPDGGGTEPVWVMYTDDGSGSYAVSVVSQECTSGGAADAVLDSATVPAP